MAITRIVLPFALAVGIFPGAMLSPAQAPASRPTTSAPLAASAPTAVPALVPFSGAVLAGDSRPLGGDATVTFLIFKDEQGGDPLWAETQAVSLDPTGHYKAQLGASSTTGLPADLFSSGEARWLEVQVAGERPQPRVLLASVPYALKAGDAATLGGLPVSAFALAGSGPAALSAADKSQSVSPDTSPSSVTTTGGKAGYIPEFSGASTIVDSSLFVTSTGAFGIGTTTPATELDVNGAATLRGSVNLPAAAATASAGANSPALELGASAYSSTAAAAVTQEFAWEAVSSGNNTAAPTANLDLLFGAGTAPKITGLSIASTGTITFAAGQKFPGTGAGTITGVTAASPLTGGGTTGAVTVGLNTSALETQLNSVYPQLAMANTFTQPITFAAGQTFPGTGAGTITSVTTTAPLTGGGTAGAVTLGLNTTTLENSLNGLYAQLDTPLNFFNGNAAFGGSVSANANNGSTTGGDAIAGTGTSGATGVFGRTDTGRGVEGIATGNGNAGYFTSDSQAYSTLYATNQASEGSGGYPNAITGATTGNGTIAITGNAAGNNSTGIYGKVSGNGSIGVTGYASSPEDGSGETSVGVVGQAADGIGVLGAPSTVSSVLVEYEGTSNSGVWGDGGPSVGSGVTGSSESGEAGFFASKGTSLPTVYAENLDNGPTGLFKTLMATSSGGTCGIGSGGSLSCTGQLKSLVSAGGGARRVETYAMQSPENWMEDFGSGKLERGVAVVRIDPAFAETVSASAEYHVFLTPKGDSKGLYVINETATGFEVRESGGGMSSLSFDYRIVAKRRGYEAQRLTDVTEDFNAASRAVIRPKRDGGAERQATPRPMPHPSTLKVAPGMHPAPDSPAVHPPAAKQQTASISSLPLSRHERATSR